MCHTISYRELRVSKIGVPLLNLCFALVALNISYTISLVFTFHRGTEPGGCGFLAALFHYFFLAGSFAFAVMVAFVLTNRTQWKGTKKIVFYLILFLANWGMCGWRGLCVTQPLKPIFMSVGVFVLFQGCHY